MKLSPLILAVVLAQSALLSGCGWVRGSGHYHVWIDPSFPEEKRTEIQETISYWQERVNSTVQFTETDDENASGDVIRFHPTTYEKLSKEEPPDNSGDWTLGYCSYDGTSSDIQLAANMNTPQFTKVAQHELGHALGLEHEPGGVMDPGWNHYLVTCQDVYQFCTVWNCNAEQLHGCTDPVDITSLSEW